MSEVFITAFGAYLPGPPVSNDEMEARLGLVDGKRSRLRRRILESNGITQRHYALDSEGNTSELNEQLAAKAIEAALRARGISMAEVDMLALGTSVPDAVMPGFASMVHGRLGAGPMEVLTAGGVCCSGMAALQGAYRALKSGTRRLAIAGASEHASRLLRAERFGARVAARSRADFDAEFLRWMLSDGAGVAVLERAPADKGVSLRIDWIDLVSRSGEMPVCMYMGIRDPKRIEPGTMWGDYKTVGEAERDGLLRIQQDTALLDQIVELGVEHWLRLTQSGHLEGANIDHVVCHHSSRFFSQRIIDSMTRAGILPERGKWFTNLYTKGNTGAASIFIALEELMTSGTLRAGETIVTVVPESARFATCIAHLTVVDKNTPRVTVAQDSSSASSVSGTHGIAGTTTAGRGPRAARKLLERPGSEVAQADPDASPPLSADHAKRGSLQERLLIDLGLVWADFNALLRQIPIVKRITEGTVSGDDYRRLLRQLRQQVIEGSRWIVTFAANVSAEQGWLRSQLIAHASDEHRDYELLERDYVAMGGTLEEIRHTPKNLGSEALSAFIFYRASQPDPVDLVGAMFIIEGLGMRKALGWADRLADTLDLTAEQTSFLRYHGSRDHGHLGRLSDVIDRLELTDAICERIVRTARVTARLYALQLEEIDHA
jgi:3-oxoacyl-[acyl-carrier-protein] synthase-3